MKYKHEIDVTDLVAAALQRAVNIVDGGEDIEADIDLVADPDYRTFKVVVTVSGE